MYDPERVRKKEAFCMLCARFFVKKCVIEVATNYFIESYYGFYHGIDLVGFKCSEWKAALSSSLAR